ncbi:MAG: phosphatidylinositol mannoside acyltransferase [Bifidobacteriaceae bacterium]|nr:phosphatidylinositol mannoside acyltransferase [Bifidobacteriaceae bacterium]
MNLTALAFRVVPRIPAPLARALFAVAADIAFVSRRKGVRQLQANLARVVPGASPRRLRALTKQGMRRYMRYFCEAFQLSRWSEAQIQRMVRPVSGDVAEAALGAERQAVAALAHMGNWDLAGAWATRHLAPVVTFAERLEHDEVFQRYLAMREALGMRIIPVAPGVPAFRHMLQAVAGAGDTPWLAPLVADRDLGRRGVEVTLFGEKALVGAGPAALALATGRPLLPVSMHREGARYVLRFGPPVAFRDDLPRAEGIQAMTQEWVSVLEEQIREHPADWHMLQRVFIADLDPGKLMRVRGSST